MLDFMERSAMKGGPHPPYSPDLAQLDFSRFGYVKQLLRGYEFGDREALLYAIEHILRGVEKLILEDAFLGWMERPRQSGSAAGEHVE
jgi:hypothetical protein